MIKIFTIVDVATYQLQVKKMISFLKKEKKGKKVMLVVINVNSELR